VDSGGACRSSAASTVEDRVRGREVLRIELDDVVSDQELGTVAEIIQTLERGDQIAPLKRMTGGIRSDASELVDPGVLAADLEVDAETARREVARRGSAGPASGP